MTFQQYFKEELDALRKSARQFAERVPELAPQLLEPGNDPDVERLLEGVAFLAASYRMKTDEHATQIAYHVAEQLLPHVLSTRPAATVVEFAPNIKALSNPHTVARGSLLHSVPVDGTRCQFTTCFDMFLWPLEVRHAELTWDSLSEARLSLTFALGKHGARSLAQPKPLCLFVWDPGDQQVSDTASTLVFWLTMKLSRMSVQVNDGESVEVKAGKVVLVDSATHPVMPWPESVSPGLRSVVEYFYLPERFHFVEIIGLDTVEIEGEELTVHFDFERLMHAKLDVAASCFRLHCTPAINVFSVPGEPIRVKPVQSSSLIRAEDIRPEHMEVRRVTQVESSSDRGQEIPKYSRFFPGRECAYTLRRERSKLDAGVDTYLVLSHASPAKAKTYDISLELECTNRHLPEKLRVGDVQGSSKKSLYRSYRNVTRVAPPTSMALGDEGLWQLVSHLSQGARLPQTKGQLQELLRIYEFSVKGSTDRLASRRVIDAIVSVRLSKSPWMFEGAPIHALKVEVTLDEAQFPNLGRAYIFGTVLAQLYHSLAPLNCVVQFVLCLRPSRQEIRWPIQLPR